VLSLLGDEEVEEADIEAKLDEILSLSLWERRLRHRKEKIQHALKGGLIARAKFVWTRSTPAQRRGYFLAGIGFDTGRQLDAIALEANQLLVQANGAVLVKDAALAVASITDLARRIFAIQPFVPDPLPANWEAVLKSWLLGQPISETGVGQDTEVLQFIEGGLIYRLPWGMEALRVRALANHDKLDDGLTLDDFELRVAVPAVETGTLNRSAALLMQAGFSSRWAAIKAVHDCEGSFESARELDVWLKSERIEQLSRRHDWPSSETADMWRSFRTGYAPPADRTWKKSAITIGASWQSGRHAPPWLPRCVAAPLFTGSRRSTRCMQPLAWPGLHPFWPLVAPRSSFRRGEAR
jgi:hypothetical protein